jgi:hypothetical protein
MTSRHPRQRLISLRLMLGASAAVVATAALGTQAAFAQNPSDASAACAKLATFSNFPVVPNARG